MGGRIVVSGMIMGPMPPVEVQWIGNSGIVMPTFRPNRPSKLPRHKMPLLSLPVELKKPDDGAVVVLPKPGVGGTLMIGIWMDPNRTVPSQSTGTVVIWKPLGSRVNGSVPPDRLITPAEALGNVRPPGKKVKGSLPPDKPRVTGVWAGMVQPFGKRVQVVVPSARLRGIGDPILRPLIWGPVIDRFDIKKPIAGGLGLPKLAMLINGSLNLKDPMLSPMPPLRALRAVTSEMVVCPKPTDPRTSMGILGIWISGIVKGPRPMLALVMLKWAAEIGTGATCKGPIPPTA